MGKRTARNRENKSRFRFIIFLIVASMLAVFIGFQLGNVFFARQMGRNSDSEEIYEAVPEEIEEEVSVSEEDGVPEETVPEADEITPDPIEEAPEPEEEVPLDDAAPEEELEEIEEQEEPETFTYYVQVGSFSDRNNALNYAETIEADGFEVEVAETEPYRVLVLGGNSREEAEEVEDELRDLGYETFIFSR